MASRQEDYIREYQDTVNRRDVGTLETLARHYDRLAEDLVAQGQALKAEYDRVVASGAAPGPYLLDRLDAYAQLTRFVSDQAADLERTIGAGYTRYAGGLAESYGKMVGGLARDAGFPSFPRAFTPELMANTVAAVEGSTGMAGMARIARDLSRQQLLAAKRAVIDGVVAGKGYRDIRADVRAKTGAGLTDTFRWIRTEGNRALRNTSRQATMKLGVTTWRRTAAKQKRTCIACLLADGKIYTTDDRHDFHVNCRCALIPQLPATLPDGTPLDAGHNVALEAGRDWFHRQDDATKAHILGPAYQPWKAGAITLDDLVQTHDHPTWGRSTRVASVARAKAAAAARQKAAPAARLTASQGLKGATDAIGDLMDRAGLDARQKAQALDYIRRYGSQGLDRNFRPLAGLDRAELQAAADVYHDAAKSYRDHQGAIGRAKAWAKAQGLDPATASPTKVVRAIRDHAAKHPAPPATFVEGATSGAGGATKNAQKHWDQVRGRLPGGNPLIAAALDAPVPVGLERKREYHNGGRVFLNGKTNAATVAHELMHLIEYREPAIKDRHVAWLLDQAAQVGDPVSTLNALTGYRHLGYNEVGYGIPGLGAYTTKVYAQNARSTDPQDHRSTELLAMWMTEIEEDTYGKPSRYGLLGHQNQDVWNSDQERDWFYLILATLLGE